MEDLIDFFNFETKPAEGSDDVSLTDMVLVIEDNPLPAEWVNYPQVVSRSLDSRNFFYADLNAVTYLRSQVRDSLEACNVKFEQLVEAVPGFDSFADGGAIPRLSAPVECSFATPFSIPAVDPSLPITINLSFFPTTYSAISELNANLMLGLFQRLMSRKGFLAGILRFLTSLVSVLIRQVGRPTFECTFLGMQKAFHICHGAHPPRNHFGLSSGRRPSLFGGCGTAILSVTV
jgi:hypothetical protein